MHCARGAVLLAALFVAPVVAQVANTDKCGPPVRPEFAAAIWMDAFHAMAIKRDQHSEYDVLRSQRSLVGVSECERVNALKVVFEQLLKNGQIELTDPPPAGWGLVRIDRSPPQLFMENRTFRFTRAYYQSIATRNAGEAGRET